MAVALVSSSGSRSTSLLLLKAVQTSLKNHRGIPDVAYNADPLTPILVSPVPSPGHVNGYYFIGGTSQGSPQWAGIIATPIGSRTPAGLSES